MSQSSLNSFYYFFTFCFKGLSFVLTSSKWESVSAWINSWLNAPSKSKNVDYLLSCDFEIQTTFYHYLYLREESWILTNPPPHKKKIKFAERKVKSIRYNIAWEIYRPANVVLFATEDLPIPKQPSITDIRCFGLVFQLPSFLSRAPIME